MSELALMGLNFLAIMCNKELLSRLQALPGFYPFEQGIFCREHIRNFQIKEM